MEDKDVGELWTELNYRHAGECGWLFDKTKELIRKLVEERALWHMGIGVRPDKIKIRADSIRAALRDFGIDPETWK